MKLIVIVLFVTASACLQIAVATICKPDSSFTMDCNTCICSSTGKEYACTEKRCPPIQYKEKFLFETNKDGYGILRPKSNNQPTDNKFGLTNRNTRKTGDRLVPAAYVKDDISGEDGYKDSDDFNYYESEDNDYDENENNSYQDNYIGPDSEETIRDDIKNSDSFNYWDKLLKKGA